MTRLPQLVQNIAPSARGAPQEGQNAGAAGFAGSCCGSLAPQLEQNIISGRIFAPQFGQWLEAVMA